jgi:putative ABC transport system ATP-binding protein
VPFDHATPHEPVLSFEGVRVATDDGVELLHGVDVVVRHGRVTVLAGPSGAGKTTLLRLGNRLEVPSAGVVRFHADDVAGLDPRELRRRVGMVFQRPVVFGGTVRDNLLVADAGADDRVMGEALERSGLAAGVLERTADDLSGGEAQRMCIARTLMTGPQVVLMDEPTSSLDPSNRRGIEGLARRLAAAGLGVLWVTHDLAQARRLGDEVVVLVDGRNATGEEATSYMDGPDGADDEPEEGAR